MNTIKQIIYVLVGDIKVSNEKNIILYMIKILYLILLLPSLVFAILLSARAGGAFGKDEKIGVIKKVLFHIAMVFWSFVLWVIGINVILGIN